MTRNAAAARAAIAAATWGAVTRVALAAEETGTEAVGEMHVTGSQFGMIIGAVAVLGVVIWLVAKKLG